MSEYRYFSRESDPRLFCCSETGEEGIKASFVKHLDELRHRCGFAFVINSGYRSAEHPEEKKKAKPGFHAKGMAADIRVQNGIQRRTIVEQAIKMGVFNGIGIAKGFVHVDTRNEPGVMWSY